MLKVLHESFLFIGKGIIGGPRLFKALLGIGVITHLANGGDFLKGLNGAFVVLQSR